MGSVDGKSMSCGEVTLITISFGAGGDERLREIQYARAYDALIFFVCGKRVT